jgi:hypothetical protein
MGERGGGGRVLVPVFALTWYQCATFSIGASLPPILMCWPHMSTIRGTNVGWVGGGWLLGHSELRLTKSTFWNRRSPHCQSNNVFMQQRKPWSHSIYIFPFDLSGFASYLSSFERSKRWERSKFCLRVHRREFCRDETPRDNLYLWTNHGVTFARGFARANISVFDCFACYLFSGTRIG